MDIAASYVSVNGTGTGAIFCALKKSDKINSLLAPLGVSDVDWSNVSAMIDFVIAVAAGVPAADIALPRAAIAEAFVAGSGAPATAVAADAPATPRAVVNVFSAVRIDVISAIRSFNNVTS
jgi:hypothetical protein